MKVIDFGLAIRRTGDAVSTLAVTRQKTLASVTLAGTLSYAAPEQLDPERAGEVGPASDVYGYGKTLYFALLGTPDPDDEEKSTLPEKLRAFLGRCTARVPERRFPTFGEVLEQLGPLHREVCPAGQPVPAAVPVGEGVAEWYYARQGQRVGPLTEGQLRALAVSGQLAASDLVWRPGMAGWAAAESIPGLLLALPPSTPTGTYAAVRLFSPGKGTLESLLRWYMSLGDGETFLKIYLDGRFQHECPARKGFDLSLRLPLGEHVLEVGQWREQKEQGRTKFALPFDRPGVYEIRFNYPDRIEDSSVECLRQP